MIPKRPQQEDNVDSWLMSYADMITLLLAFFVIFVSTSTPKQDELAAATKGMHDRFGSLSLDTPYDGVYRDVVGIISSANQDRNIAIDKTTHGIQIELSALHFFGNESADIGADQLPVLMDIAQALKKGQLANCTIEIEGHTDDTAVGSPEFATNWELAAARATRIVRLLIEQGVEPERLRATSYAATRPVAPNEDAMGTPIPQNHEKNQRVVIRVEQIK